MLLFNEGLLGGRNRHFQGKFSAETHPPPPVCVPAVGRHPLEHPSTPRGPEEDTRGSPGRRRLGNDPASPGGGVCGLCAATRLLELGHHDFELLEAADRPGGLASSYRDEKGVCNSGGVGASKGEWPPGQLP